MVVEESVPPIRIPWIKRRVRARETQTPRSVLLALAHKMRQDMGTRPTIEVKDILRDMERPGFDDPHHRVIFIIQDDELEPIEIGIWLSRMFPDEQLVPVAQTFLAGRLAQMTKAALQGALLPQEIKAIWGGSQMH